MLTRERGNWCEDSSFWHLQTDSQAETQCARLSSVRVYVGTSCLCHWAFRPVIKLLSAARPRPLGLNSEHGRHQGQAMREAHLTHLLSYCTSTFIHKHLEHVVGNKRRIGCGLYFKQDVQCGTPRRGMFQDHLHNPSSHAVSLVVYRCARATVLSPSRAVDAGFHTHPVFCVVERKHG